MGDLDSQNESVLKNLSGENSALCRAGLRVRHGVEGIGTLLAWNSGVHGYY